MLYSSKFPENEELQAEDFTCSWACTDKNQGNISLNSPTLNKYNASLAIKKIFQGC